MTSDVAQDVVSAADTLCDALRVSACELAQSPGTRLVRCALLVQKKGSCSSSTDGAAQPLLQVVSQPGGAANTYETEAAASSAMSVTELAVVVSARAVREALVTYCTATCALTSAIAYDRPVSHYTAQTNPLPSSSLLLPPLLLQASLLQRLPPSLLTLALLLLPAHNGLWNERRARLTRHEEAKAVHYRTCLQELLVTDLVLSAYWKLQEAWVYRGWLMQHIAQRCDGHMTVRALRAQDDATFFFAVDQHGMNYNAWQYRRLRLRLLCECSSSSSNDAAVIVGSEGDVEEECACVQRFLRTHNADSSAASYLLFLLHRLAASNVDAARQMWLRLMKFTQHELRVRVEQGHECMWWLRDGLLHWAVTRAAGGALPGGWTVQDELRWTSAYVEGFVTHDASEGQSAKKPLPLLSPGTQTVREAAVQCSGSVAWSSYLACRHGLCLIQLLRRRVSK